MGNCMSISDEERAAIERNRRIERENYESHIRQEMEVKLLLLGAGESGKSTVLKQMQIIHAPENEPAFSQSDLEKIWAPRIRQNITSLLKEVCEAACTLELADQIQCQDAFAALHNSDLLSSAAEGDLGAMSKALENIKVFWADPGVQQLWARRSEYQVIESHVKYFAKLETIFADGYLPTEEDVVLCRMRTIGIVSTKLLIYENVFNIYDVGGQRNERRKWIHCFDDVTAVIFVAALSEYDQVLFEDSSQNRMVEAIDIFHEYLYSSWFEHSAMILFLNKEDLFEHKLTEKDIASVEEWSDFPGPSWSQLSEADKTTESLVACKAAGVKYFLTKFLAATSSKRSAKPQKHVFPHITTATNTENVKNVFEDCREAILRSSMEQSGFMT